MMSGSFPAILMQRSSRLFKYWSAFVYRIVSARFPHDSQLCCTCRSPSAVAGNRLAPPAAANRLAPPAAIGGSISPATASSPAASATGRGGGAPTLLRSRRQLWLHRTVAHRRHHATSRATACQYLPGCGHPWFPVFYRHRTLSSCLGPAGYHGRRAVDCCHDSSLSDHQVLFSICPPSG